jgi:hypothetical protein
MSYLGYFTNFQNNVVIIVVFNFFSLLSQIKLHWSLRTWSLWDTFTLVETSFVILEGKSMNLLLGLRTFFYIYNSFIVHTFQILDKCSFYLISNLLCGCAIVDFFSALAMYFSELFC